MHQTILLLEKTMSGFQDVKNALSQTRRGIRVDNLSSIYTYLSTRTGQPDSGERVWDLLLQLEKTDCLNESLYNHIMNLYNECDNTNFAKILAVFNGHRFAINSDHIRELHSIMINAQRYPHPHLGWHISRSLELLADAGVARNANVLNIIDDLNGVIKFALRIPDNQFCNLPHIFNRLKLFNYLNPETYRFIIDAYRTNDRARIRNIESISYILDVADSVNFHPPGNRNLLTHLFANAHAIKENLIRIGDNERCRAYLIDLMSRLPVSITAVSATLHPQLRAPTERLSVTIPRAVVTHYPRIP